MYTVLFKCNICVLFLCSACNALTWDAVRAGMGTSLSPAYILLCYWLSLKCSLTVSLPPFLPSLALMLLSLPLVFYSLSPLLLPCLFLSHWRREVGATVFSGWEGECHVEHIGGISLVSWSKGSVSLPQLSSYPLLYAVKGKPAGGYKGVPSANSAK